MDSNEKSQSKFPRSSLRARNKTILMAPAEVQDFTPKSVSDALSLDDIFDDPDFGGSVNPTNGAETAVAAVQGLLDELTSEHQLSTTSVVEEAVESDSPIADVLSSFEDEGELLVSKASIVTEAPLPTEDVDAGVFEEDAALEPPPVAPPIAPMARIVRTLEPQPPPTFAARVQDEPISREEPDASEPEEQEAPSLEASRAPFTEPAHTAVADTHRYNEEYMGVMEEGERAEVVWKKLTKLVGFLVSFATNPLGSYIELREGRLLVSSELNNADNCLLINDASVSAMHAIMRISGDGSILILDQLSQHGTRIRRADSGNEEALMGEKSHLQHGDVVIFGECEYDVCILKPGRRSA